jgi:hypothetical protein
MAITRRLAATTILVSFAIGLAAPASAGAAPTGKPAPYPADPPSVGSTSQMSGHYTETQTSPDHPNNPPNVRDWYFTPCGDGCASVADQQGGPTMGQAQLTSGQWTLDTTDDVDCEDNSTVSNALSAHRTWDATTLAGTLALKQILPACGDPAGGGWSMNIQFKQVS